jgi:hypothetical protein
VRGAEKTESFLSSRRVKYKMFRGRMPRRKGSFVSGCYYHVFNRAIAGERLFHIYTCVGPSLENELYLPIISNQETSNLK